MRRREAFLLGRPLPLVCNGSSLEDKIGEKSTSAEITCSVKISAPANVNINNERYEFSMGELEEMFDDLVV